jgi:hypothetical protein
LLSNKLYRPVMWSRALYVVLVPYIRSSWTFETSSLAHMSKDWYNNTFK